jgi:outer membrane protein assembly factor BamE (lipoprotein component of BamABCDE complex)
MENFTSLLKIFCGMFLLVSCTTVKVAKVEVGQSPDGLRYSLGKPFIKVTPNPEGDGSYTAELIYLPDNDRTYAVSSSSFMSKHTLDLNVDGSGVLSKLALSKDATGNSSEAAGALGELAKSEITRRQKEADEKRAKIEAEIKSNEDAIKVAVELRDQKIVQLASNERDIAVLEATSSTPLSDAVKERLRELRSSNFKLNLEILDLERKIGNLKTSLNTLENAANIAAEKKDELTAYGPVFFQIVEVYENSKLKSVKLEPVKQGEEIQKKFKTVAKPEKPSATTVGETSTAPALLNKSISVKMNRDKSFSFVLTFNGKVLRIDESKSYFESDPLVKFREFNQDQQEVDEEAIMLTTKQPTSLKPGKYVVNIVYLYALPGNGGESSAKSVFTLTVK